MSTGSSTGSWAGRGFRRESSGFEHEFADYLQRRLRLLALCLTILLGIVLLLDVTLTLGLGGTLRDLQRPMLVAILVDTICIAGWWMLSRKRGLPGRTLTLLD